MANINLSNVYSLTDFQRNAKTFVSKLKRNKKPLILTVNGKAEVIVQDAKTYQEMIERLELSESITGILSSIEEFKEGKGMPVEEVFRKLQAKHGL
jgi:PHD/YefM family antitoxin component YafN of YafNO toxin-antitoxin module